MAFALSFTSCSKDGNDGVNGEQGIQGIQGTAGQDGVDGTNGTDGKEGEDGTNGTDGNANVQNIIIDVSQKSGATYILDIEKFTPTVLKNDAILYYLRKGNLYYPIPGVGPNSAYIARVYASEGKAFINFKELDGISSYQTVAGEVDDIQIIIIESSSSVAGKSSSYLAALSAAGVDANDYHAVMQYYGLN